MSCVWLQGTGQLVGPDGGYKRNTGWVSAPGGNTARDLDFRICSRVPRCVTLEKSLSHSGLQSSQSEKETSNASSRAQPFTIRKHNLPNPESARPNETPDVYTYGALEKFFFFSMMLENFYSSFQALPKPPSSGKASLIPKWSVRLLCSSNSSIQQN